jgi:ketosteroid isomerase-like protein
MGERHRGEAGVIKEKDPAMSPSVAEARLRPDEMERIARELFEAFNRRDLAGALALVHEDVVLAPVSAELLRGGEPYRGREGIEQYLGDVQTHWEVLRVNPVQIRAAGRAVVALGQVTGSGPLGSFSEMPTKWVLKFRDGLVVSGQVFADPPPQARSPAPTQPPAAARAQATQPRQLAL